MKESFGEKLKRLFGRNRADGSAEAPVLQPDILDVVRTEEPAPAEPVSAEEPAVTETLVPEDIPEEGPRFSSEDLARMSEGSWRPEGEQDIADMLVEVPEMEEIPAADVSPEKAELQESMAKDSAAIDELAAQMETMVFFSPDSTESAVPEEISEPESIVPEDETASVLEEEIHEEDIPEEQTEEEEISQEDLSEESVLADPEEEVPCQETDTAEEQAEETTADDTEETAAPEETAEEEIPEPEKMPQEEAEISAEPDEAEEVPEEEDSALHEIGAEEELQEEPADCETAESREEAVRETEGESVYAKDLTDLWGLNKTQEEIEKEKRQERRRRRFTYAAVLLIILGIAGSGAYAYEQGWRINLFYEVLHSTEETPAGNGKKKRPDSSEFEQRPDESGSESSDPSGNTGTGEKRPGFSVLERLEQLLSQDISDVFTDGEKEPVQETQEPDPVTEPAKPEPVVQEQSGGDTEKESEPEKEFVGITVSKEEDPEKIVEEGPSENLEKPDQVTVEETGPIQTVEVERAVNYYLSADGSVREIRALPGEIATVNDLLDKAGVTLGADDIIEPSRESPIAEGDSVKITRILYKQVTETEVIPGEAVEKLTPVLRSGRTYAINSDNQADGEKEVTYLEKYVDGVLESREEISSEVTKEPTDYILLVGANVPASPINGAQYTDVQVSASAPSDYTAVYSGRCTAYNFKKGSYGASGMYLSQGMVAVDPNVIPYGSLLYITNGDGSFVYGWAIAADYCEASAAGSAVVDLFFDTYREAALFGARNLNVYVVKQLTQSDLAGYVAREAMFRSRVPA